MLVYDAIRPFAYVVHPTSYITHRTSYIPLPLSAAVLARRAHARGLEQVRTRDLAAEVLLDHQARDGAGRRAAEAGVLHDDPHGDLRILHGGVGDEHGVVVTQRVLGGARLGGHRDALDLGATRRAGRDNLLHAALDDVPVLGVDRD